MALLVRALICLALLGVLAAPAALAAEPEEREGFAGAFQLKASNGYSITVLAMERRSDGQGFLLIFASSEKAGVFYSTKAKVTAEGIEADLGRLGRIDVDLKLSGRKKVERSSVCDPESVKFPGGRYEGTIEFRGEEGYTRASATRVPLILSPYLNILCPGDGGEGLGPGLPGARLRVFARGQARRLSLQVNANRPGARMFYEALTEEIRDGIEISRAVEGVVPGSSFDYDPLLRTATLDPPAPFSGSASFHRNALPANRWTGNLAIDFPGRSNVPLTGAAVRAGLVHAHLNP